MRIEQIIADHPGLEREDLLAALEFAALAAGGHRVVPLGAAQAATLAALAPGVVVRAVN
jgi:hypothetical protein